MLKRKTKYFLYKFLSLFSVVRGYNILVIAIAQYLASIFILAQNKRALQIILDINLLLIVLSSTLAIAAGYIINNFYDSDKDLINRPNKTKLDRIVSQEFKLKTYFLLNFLSALLAFFVSFNSGLFFSVYIFLLWFYSHKLKKYPFIGNLIAAFLAVLPFFGILMYYKNFNYVIFVHAVLVILLILLKEITKDLASIKGDLTNNYRTIPVEYGEKFAKYSITVLSILILIPISLLLKYFNIGYMSLYIYIMIAVLILINFLIYKANHVKQYKKVNFIIKILILTGVFSILLLDPSVLLHGKLLFEK